MRAACVVIVVLAACGPRVWQSGPAAEYFASERAQVGSESERECQAGNASVCTTLGIKFLAEDKPGSEDFPAALRLHVRACNLGDAPGCYNLAHQYWKGKGTEVDLARAASLYRRACLLGLHQGCGFAERLEAANDTAEETAAADVLGEAERRSEVAPIRTLIRIETSVPAEVFIDGWHRGAAPIENEVSPGEHQVKVIAGSEIFNEKVPVGEGVTAAISGPPWVWVANLNVR